jgi:hypothetical protein
LVPEPATKPATTTGSDNATVAPAGHDAPTGHDRDGASGWKPAANHSEVARTVDRLLLPAGWTVVEKGSSHESGENPSSSATDRPASGWKGVQR